MKRWARPALVLLVLFVGGLGVYWLVPAQPKHYPLIPAKPEYCWLAFGPEAKLRFLVRLQGDRLQGLKVYIDDGDRNQITDPVESDMLYCTEQLISHRLNFLIDDPENQTTYTITGMGRYDDPPRPRLSVDVHIQGSVEFRQYCDVVLASNPEDAKEAHFNGPLTVELTKKALWTLQRGDEPTDLRVHIGTMDPEEGSYVAVYTVGSEDTPAFPVGVHPVVDIEFPAKDNGAPIKRRYSLDKPC